MARITSYIFFILVVMSGVSMGDIIHVPADSSTIQGGLNGASEGDTVLVAPGTYYENIVWPTTQGIDLRSEMGPESTAIDADSIGRVITIDSTARVDTTTVICGFTIRNGNAVGVEPDNMGGGILCSIGSSPMISGNTIRNNCAESYGGGICVRDSASPVISANRIVDNSAYCGGGIALYFSVNSSAEISGNTIENNSSGSLDGAGIACCGADASSQVLSGNTIVSNEGGGIACYSLIFSSIEVSGNVIENNLGTGISIYSGITSSVGLSRNIREDDQTVISGNTIRDNSSTGILCFMAWPVISENTITLNSESGIVCEGSFCSPTISGNTIAYNSTPTLGGGISCHQTLYTYPTISCNTIIHNTAGSFGGGIACYGGGSAAISGNTIAGNGSDGLGDGIYCSDGSSPEISLNNIYENGFGIYNAESSQTILAEYNWWGDASGPYHPTLNPGGLGDTVGDYVDFDSWAQDVGIEEDVKTDSLSSLRLSPKLFRDNLDINYSLFQSGRVSIKIYNLAGQLINTLTDEMQSAGEHALHWRPGDLSPGVYFIRLETSDLKETRRCLLLK